MDRQAVRINENGNWGHRFNDADDGVDWSRMDPNQFAQRNKKPEPKPDWETANAHNPTWLLNFPLPPDHPAFGIKAPPKRAAALRMEFDMTERGGGGGEAMPPLGGTAGPSSTQWKRPPASQAAVAKKKMKQRVVAPDRFDANGDRIWTDEETLAEVIEKRRGPNVVPAPKKSVTAAPTAAGTTKKQPPAGVRRPSASGGQQPSTSPTQQQARREEVPHTPAVPRRTDTTIPEGVREFLREPVGPTHDDEAINLAIQRALLEQVRLEAQVARGRPVSATTRARSPPLPPEEEGALLPPVVQRSPPIAGRRAQTPSPDDTPRTQQRPPSPPEPVPTRQQTPPPPAQRAAPAVTAAAVTPPRPAGTLRERRLRAQEVNTVDPNRRDAATVAQPTAGRRHPQHRAAQQTANNNGEWELNDFTYEALLELGRNDVPLGLSKQQLRKYVPKPYRCRRRKKPKKKKKEEDDDDSSSATSEEDEPECTICLDEMEEGVESLELACGHVFHGQCILRWLSKTNKCPTCRFEIPRQAGT